MNWKTVAAGAVALGIATACSTEVLTDPQATSLPTPRYDHGTSGPTVTPSLIIGNPTCEQLGYESGFKVDPPLDGDYASGSISVAFHSEGKLVDFTASPNVQAVLVKGGPQANLYNYGAVGTDHDNNLRSPDFPAAGMVPQISHVTFCYSDGEVDIGGDPDISGMKYYDANVNGRWDVGEVGIPNWQIQVQYDAEDPAIISTGVGGAFTFTGLVGSSYTVQEITASNWIQTGNTENQTVPPVNLNNFIYTLTPASDTPIIGLNFGNVCVGAGGGRTLGFWSNPNGQKLISNADIAALVALNLRNANGTHYDPPNKTNFRTWLLNANATNMAYMLSAQLAAMKLNVLEGFVAGGALVYAPGVGAADFISINDLMTAANTQLGTNGNTPSGHSARAIQTVIKDALDSANNNQNFLQAGPQDCAAPVFPAL